MATECDFCGKVGNWISVLRDTQLEKKDGSDIILCNDCLNNYAGGDYDKIKLEGGRRVTWSKIGGSIKK